MKALFQSTLAFAPTQDDLNEGYFDSSVLTFAEPDTQLPPGTDALLAQDKNAAQTEPARQIA